MSSCINERTNKTSRLPSFEKALVGMEVKLFEDKSMERVRSGKEKKRYKEELRDWYCCQTPHLEYQWLYSTLDFCGTITMNEKRNKNVKRIKAFEISHAWEKVRRKGDQWIQT